MFLCRSGLQNCVGVAATITIIMEHILEVEAVDDDLFIGKHLYQPLQARGSYGGHIVAHAMKAALMTMGDQDKQFLFSSLHCYFISPVNPEKVVYHVDSRKNGRTFCIRSIRAIQKGKTVFHCLVSFKLSTEGDADLPYNKHPMPSIPGPSDRDNLPYESSSSVLLKIKYCTPSSWKHDIHISPLPSDEPRMFMWMKLKKELDRTDSNLHRIALGYASDWYIAGPIRMKYPQYELGLLTSLDHSVWFHKDIDFNQWHLFDFQCESSGHGQSLNILRIYTEDGVLVATAVQQGLLRAKL